jgi:hypothetical protein
MQLFHCDHFNCVLETVIHMTNFVHIKKDSVFELFTCLKQSRRTASLHAVLPSCKNVLLKL